MRKHPIPKHCLALALLQLAVPAWAQTPAAQTSLGSGLLQMLLGLGGVIALLVGSLWLLKRLTAVRGTGAGMMRVVAATAVGGRERVVIVEVGSTWLVLGVAPGRVSPLAEIPRQALPEASQGVSQPAPEWLQRFISRR
jgi:flagellar protein FliO/FliZ